MATGRDPLGAVAIGGAAGQLGSRSRDLPCARRAAAGDAAGTPVGA